MLGAHSPRWLAMTRVLGLDSQPWGCLLLVASQLANYSLLHLIMVIRFMIATVAIVTIIFVLAYHRYYSHSSFTREES